ncbi:MAG: ABC transporter permease [Proteobacteria bacterium]|nr:ABC transporter permease [Pseudomonadota bacterium]
MRVFLFKRLVTMFLTLLVATLIVFVVLEILPGDPAAVMLGINAEPETLAALREEMGLNRPVVVRYISWLGDLVQGDLGTSYTYDVPVFELIKERIQLSFPLAVFAITLSTVIAIPLGIIAASNHSNPLDFIVMIFSQLGIAVPNFWFALLLVIVFSVSLRWLPAGGFAGWDAGMIPALTSLLLPTIALALPQSAILARVTRSSMLEVLKEDYIRTAQAKGNGRLRILWRHALRNAMIPVVTIMGLQFSFLLAGTIIIENVFYLPGIGRLIFQSIAQRDLIVVKNLVILLAVMVILINFIVDLLYASIDPRLRGGEDA